MSSAPRRLAIVVSHPVQYYAPLYERLARRGDLAVKVFFTWHGGREPVKDTGFQTLVSWDIPLTNGYEHEVVPNVAADPGDHHFFGLNNPALVERVMDWRPDAVHVTGWAWYSHLAALREFHRRGVPILFRGDSHLLDSTRSGPRWWLKSAVLRKVFSWPAAFLFVGRANRAYYDAFRVDAGRLFHCPHSIDVARFAEPSGELEARAKEWRARLGLSGRPVLLFAGKFERKKRPLELMRAVQSCARKDLALIMAGSGPLEAEVRALAAADSGRFRVLPFQNQSVMPVVYRLGDVFVLPSAYEETWGLAVNEAMACGRPVLVSDRVGCASDIVDPECGRVFPWRDWSAMTAAAEEMLADPKILEAFGRAASRRAADFDVTRTESAVADCVMRVGAV